MDPDRLSTDRARQGIAAAAEHPGAVWVGALHDEAATLGFQRDGREQGDSGPREGHLDTR